MAAILGWFRRVQAHAQGNGFFTGHISQHHVIVGFDLDHAGRVHIFNIPHGIELFHVLLPFRAVKKFNCPILCDPQYLQSQQ